MAEMGQVDFEEGTRWLLSSILDDSSDSKLSHRHYHQQDHWHRHRSPAEPLSQFHQHPKSTSRQHYRPKVPNNLWSGGQGMQAIFLHTAKQSCGTGVFLPIRDGTASPPKYKKPACSPVLIPYRIVQALNLNVPQLGLQLRQASYSKNNQKKGGDSNSIRNKKVKEETTKCSSIKTQNQSSHPEMFLPKEWSY